ncbi:MAG TPA: alpha/beta hydrolase [Gemmatimonadales bacterium]|nr:alpha/beta hydrolase [Gemmatimonadales bacterium]
MWILLCLLVPDTTSSSFPVTLDPAESVQVTIAGAGEPVVLLPGLFGSAFGYRRLLPALADAGYRAIVIEPLGVGSSGRPERADYSLTAQADRIARVLDVLGVRRSVVVAHAIGGSMAFRLAYRRPDLVRGIVSLEGGPAETATTPGFRRALRLVPWVKLFGGAKRIRKKVGGFLRASSGDATWVTEEVLDGYTAGATRDLDAALRAYLAMARAREPEALAPRLGAIRCPVRLLVGGVPHEGAPNGEEVALLAGRLPRFSLDTIAGAGHFLYEERPEAVVRAIHDLGGEAP